jgi:hypothetical protein
MQFTTVERPITADDTLVWDQDRLLLLDQRVLPAVERFVVCDSVEATAEAITAMVVRGAPAIGIAAAYGVVLAARARYAAQPSSWRGRAGCGLRSAGRIPPDRGQPVLGHRALPPPGRYAAGR